MEPTVKLGVGEYRDSTTDATSIRLEVTNVGESPIQTIKLEWEYQFPKPISINPKVSETARRFSFGTRQGEEDAPLPVGDSRTYLFPAEWFPDMRAVMAWLPPELYSIRLTMDGKEEVGISGPMWNKFIEGRFGKPATPKFSISRERMAIVQDVVGRIVELAKAFKVHPPREVTDDPAILDSPEVVEKLGQSKWWLKFADGHEEMLSLPELVVLVHHVIAIKMQIDEMLEGSEKLNVRMDFAVEDLMQPSFVRQALKKLILEGLPQTQEGQSHDLG